MALDPIDQDFLQALALARERDATYDSWFYDQSIVYVYGHASGDEFDVAGNLLHELGHAELANTPLGFLHQTLFELAASLATRLYLVEIAAVLTKHAPPAPEMHLPEDGMLGLPRPVARRKETEEAAQALFDAARIQLTEALSTEPAASLASLFRRVQARRKALADAARFSHEVAATDTQLGGRPSLVGKYAELVPTFDLPSLQAALVAKRASLESPWKEALAFAQRVNDTAGHHDAAITAARVAHHFAYPGLRLLDMSEPEFIEAIHGGRLGVDVRVRRLTENTAALATACRGYHEEEELLRASLENDLADFPVATPRSFFAWIDQYVLRADVCKAAAWIPRHPPKPPGFNDDWTKSPIRPSKRRPPIVLSNGRIIAASVEEAALARADIVRARHVRVVDRIIARLTQ